MVSSAESAVVTAAIDNGTVIIAEPSIVIPKRGANISSSIPFKINDPNPSVMTKNGSNVLVKIGQTIE